jgi:hypothetical protein
MWIVSRSSSIILGVVNARPRCSRRLRRRDEFLGLDDVGRLIAEALGEILVAALHLLV